MADTGASAEAQEGTPFSVRAYIYSYEDGRQGRPVASLRLRTQKSFTFADLSRQALERYQKTDPAEGAHAQVATVLNDGNCILDSSDCIDFLLPQEAVHFVLAKPHGPSKQNQRAASAVPQDNRAAVPSPTIARSLVQAQTPQKSLPNPAAQQTVTRTPKGSHAATPASKVARSASQPPSASRVAGVRTTSTSRPLSTLLHRRKPSTPDNAVSVSSTSPTSPHPTNAHEVDDIMGPPRVLKREDKSARGDATPGSQKKPIPVDPYEIPSDTDMNEPFIARGTPGARSRRPSITSSPRLRAPRTPKTALQTSSAKPTPSKASTATPVSLSKRQQVLSRVAAGAETICLSDSSGSTSTDSEPPASTPIKPSAKALGKRSLHTVNDHIEIVEQGREESRDATGPIPQSPKPIMVRHSKGVTPVFRKGGLARSMSQPAASLQKLAARSPSTLRPQRRKSDVAGEGQQLAMNEGLDDDILVVDSAVIRSSPVLNKRGWDSPTESSRRSRPRELGTLLSKPNSPSHSSLPAKTGLQRQLENFADQLDEERMAQLAEKEVASTSVARIPTGAAIKEIKGAMETKVARPAAAQKIPDSFFADKKAWEEIYISSSSGDEADPQQNPEPLSNTDLGAPCEDIQLSQASNRSNRMSGNRRSASVCSQGSVAPVNTLNKGAEKAPSRSPASTPRSHRAYAQRVRDRFSDASDSDSDYSYISESSVEFTRPSTLTTPKVLRSRKFLTSNGSDLSIREKPWWTPMAWIQRYETSFGLMYQEVADGPFEGFIPWGSRAGQYLPGFGPPSKEKLEQAEKLCTLKVKHELLDDDPEERWTDLRGGETNPSDGVSGHNAKPLSVTGDDAEVSFDEDVDRLGDRSGSGTPFHLYSPNGGPLVLFPITREEEPKQTAPLRITEQNVVANLADQLPERQDSLVPEGDLNSARHASSAPSTDSDSTSVLIARQLTRQSPSFSPSPPSNQELGLLMSSSPASKSHKKDNMIVQQVSKPTKPDNADSSSSEASSGIPSGTPSLLPPSPRATSMAPNQVIKTPSLHLSVPSMSGGSQGRRTTRLPAKMSLSGPLFSRESVRLRPPRPTSAPGSTTQRKKDYDLSQRPASAGSDSKSETPRPLIELPQMSAEQKAQYDRISLSPGTRSDNPDPNMQQRRSPSPPPPRTFRSFEQDFPTQSSSASFLDHVLDEAPIWLTPITDVGPKAPLPPSDKDTDVPRRRASLRLSKSLDKTSLPKTARVTFAQPDAERGDELHDTDAPRNQPSTNKDGSSGSGNEPGNLLSDGHTDGPSRYSASSAALSKDEIDTENRHAVDDKSLKDILAPASPIRDEANDSAIGGKAHSEEAGDDDDSKSAESMLQKGPRAEPIAKLPVGNAHSKPATPRRPELTSKPIFRSTTPIPPPHIPLLTQSLSKRRASTPAPVSRTPALAPVIPGHATHQQPAGENNAVEPRGDIQKDSKEAARQAIDNSGHNERGKHVPTSPAGFDGPGTDASEAKKRRAQHGLKHTDADIGGDADLTNQVASFLTMNTGGEPDLANQVVSFLKEEPSHRAKSKRIKKNRPRKKSSSKQSDSADSENAKIGPPEGKEQAGIKKSQDPVGTGNAEQQRRSDKRRKRDAEKALACDIANQVVLDEGKRKKHKSDKKRKRSKTLDRDEHPQHKFKEEAGLDETPRKKQKRSRSDGSQKAELKAKDTPQKQPMYFFDTHGSIDNSVAKAKTRELIEPEKGIDRPGENSKSSAERFRRSRHHDISPKDNVKTEVIGPAQSSGETNTGGKRKRKRNDKSSSHQDAAHPAEDPSSTRHTGRPISISSFADVPDPPEEVREAKRAKRDESPRKSPRDTNKKSKHKRLAKLEKAKKEAKARDSKPDLPQAMIPSVEQINKTRFTASTPDSMVSKDNSAPLPSRAPNVEKRDGKRKRHRYTKQKAGGGKEKHRRHSLAASEAASALPHLRKQQSQMQSTQQSSSSLATPPATSRPTSPEPERA